MILPLYLGLSGTRTCTHKDRGIGNNSVEFQGLQSVLHA